MFKTEGAYHADLMLRIAVKRDREAFSALFDHYAPRVKHFMMRKGANSEQAEDLVQETMVAVWTKAQLYVAERGSVTTWIYTIARNLRIDRLRREGTVQFTDLDDYDAPDDKPDADVSYGRMQEDKLVADALSQLPEEQRQLLILSFVDDVPQSEIAERLKLPLGTVKSRMRLAYRRLRKMLETVT